MKIPIEKTLPVTLYFRALRYELLRRRAFHEGHNSVQRSIDQRLFRSNWLEELKILQDEQRKLGYRDSIFYHPKVLRTMGLKVKRGRRQLWPNLKK